MGLYRRSISVFECPKCHIYLDTYAEAGGHFDVSHPGASKRLITAVDFPGCTVLLERSTSEKSPALSPTLKVQTKRKGSQGTKTNCKTAPRNPKTGQREIKLDTLKAGEIEALITDLLKSSSNQEKGLDGIRKSGRTVKKFQRNYEESDAEILSESERSEEQDSNCSDTDDDDFSDSNNSDGSESSKNKRKSMKKPAPRKSKEAGKKDKTSKDKKEQEFFCRVCKTDFFDRTKYFHHMKSQHTKKGKFTCTVDNCKASFPLNNMKKFNRHMDKHYNPRSRLNTQSGIVLDVPPVQKDGVDYTCPQCKKWFFPLARLKEHIQRAKNPKSLCWQNRNQVIQNGPIPKGPYKCEICTKVITFYKQHLRHLKHHERASAPDPNKPHVCPICKHRYSRRYHLRNHMVSHLKNNPIKCKFSGCGRTFTSAYQLQKHAELHAKTIEERLSAKCPQCPAAYTSNSSLRNHTLRCHSGSSSNPLNYKQKKSMIKPVQDLVNSVTGKGPSDESRFDVESIHLTDRVIVTEDLHDIHVKGETLSPQKNPEQNNDDDDDKEQESNTDMSEDDSDSGPVIDKIQEKFALSEPVMQKIKEQGPECLKFIQKCADTRRFKYYKVHKKGDFKCEQCPWTCSGAMQLRQHMKNCHDKPTASGWIPQEKPPGSKSGSTGDINMFCGTCGYQSKSAKDLADHMFKIHEGNKPKFPCSFCGLPFPTKARKDIHVNNVHFNGKTFHCKKCKCKYSDIIFLRNHVRIKHGIASEAKPKTYKCKTCGAVYRQKKNYEQHVALHTDKRELTTCKICRQTLATVPGLRRHIRLVHFGVGEKTLAKNNPGADPTSNFEQINTGGNSGENAPSDTSGMNREQNSLMDNYNQGPSEQSDAIIGF